MEERIKYLLRQYSQNACSREELEEFFSYIHRATNDDIMREMIRKVYDDIGKTHSSATYVDEYGKLVLPPQEQTVTAFPQTRPVAKIKRSILRIAIAACIVIAAGITWIKLRPLHPVTGIAATHPLTKKFTERSEYKYLLLPDSTQVWLNASSSLEFADHFPSAKREVFLSGEAYFDVKHAENAPFIIHTGNVSTTVLGTAFNIKAYPGHQNIIVSVSRGKVKVSLDDKLVATLTRGQQVKVNSGDSKVTEKSIDLNRVAAWQQGDMVYEDERFEDIIADMERIYNVSIRIANTSIRQLQVSTSFRREIGVEQALQVLCKLTDSELTQAGGLYIIQ